jgi:hypothetical protein
MVGGLIPLDLGMDEDARHRRWTLARGGGWVKICPARAGVVAVRPTA